LQYCLPFQEAHLFAHVGKALIYLGRHVTTVILRAIKGVSDKTDETSIDTPHAIWNPSHAGH